MTTPDNVRYAHDIIDDIANGYTPNSYDLNLLRGFLPEKPQQKTLGELVEEVKQVWGATVSNTWPEDTHGELDGWLWEFHTQLEGLASTDSKPSQPSQASPKLPEGMLLATHPINGLCVVSPRTNDIGQYKIFHLDDSYVSGADVSYVEADALTFIDAEPAKPAHPEFLETEADYRKAPEGTIVACEDSSPWYKFGSEWSSVDFCGTKDDKGMSRARRRVLRWGNE